MNEPKNKSIDGGWAWMVLFSGIIANLIMWGSCYNVGILNVMFLDAFNDTRGNTAWIGAVGTSLISSLGPVSSMFVNRIGFRWTIILGGVLTSVGSMTSFFATSVIHLILSLGVVGGFGLGLCYTPIISAVALYFDKYRIMASALSSVGSGIGTIIFAPLIQNMADIYGWRGAMLILGGLQLHLCLCGALIRPLPKHVLSPMSSLDITGSDHSCKKPRRIFQFEILKNGKVVLFMFNILFINLGEFIVYLHFSAYAIAEGSSYETVALLMSIAGLASIISRLFIPSAATDDNVGVLLVYAGSLGVTGIVVVVTPFLMPYVWGQMLIAFLFGFYANGYVPLMAPLAVEFAGLQFLTAVCGVVNFTSGIGSLLGPPLAGWIYDVSEEYRYGFYLAGVMLLLSSLIILIAPMVPTLETNTSVDVNQLILHDKNVVTRGRTASILSDCSRATRRELTRSMLSIDIRSSILVMNWIGSKDDLVPRGLKLDRRRRTISSSSKTSATCGGRAKNDVESETDITLER